LKQLTVRKRVFIEHILCGMGWLVVGVILLFDNIILNSIGSIIMAGLIIGTVYPLFAKKERQDEMADKHMNMAKAITLDIIMMLSFIFGAVYIFASFGGKEIQIDLFQIFYFLIGGVLLMTGGIFLGLEGAGE